MADEHNPQDIERLAAQLRDGNKSVREAAASALVQIGEPAIPYLVQALNRQVGGYYGRFQARDSLVAIGMPARAALLEVVRSNPHSDWGAAALGVLAALRDVSFIPLFVENLASRHLDTQTAATTGLVNLKDAAVPVLVQALDHEDWRVRYSAIRALGSLKVVTVIPRLLESLTDPKTLDVAAAALCQMGIASARSAFAVLLQSVRDGAANQFYAARSITYDDWNIGQDKPEITRLFLALVRDRTRDMPLRQMALAYVTKYAPAADQRAVFHDLLDESSPDRFTSSVLHALRAGNYDESLLLRAMKLADDPASHFNNHAEDILFEIALNHDPADHELPVLVDWLIERSRPGKQITNQVVAMWLFFPRDTLRQITLRALAVRGLGGLKSSAGIPALVDRLDDDAEYQLNVGADEQPEYEKVTIGELAERALRQIGTPEALAALENWRKTKG
jgi:HEAT repeat protein